MKTSLDEADTAMSGNRATIANYDVLMQAVASGSIEDMNQAVLRMVITF